MTDLFLPPNIIHHSLPSANVQT
ncbi:hypothetical protein J002_05213 [Cryptococcus neoformans]|nr:hypothetical protein J002_06479 [Cryptococcus neoformans var. grubii]OXH49400.1 hypothetical protein J002_05213 [Cryptococcus neoformans var. grubii]